MEDEFTPGVAELVAHDDAQPDSLLETLAAKRKDIAESKETYIPVPGYDRSPPLLLVKYRLLEGPELTKIGEKVRMQYKGRWERSLNAAIDTFIAACLGIYVDRGDGTPVPLTLNGQPISGFNEDLAVALKYQDTLPEGGRHSDVVLGLFAHNDIAITSHAMQLNRWFGNTTIDVSEDFLGGNL